MSDLFRDISLKAIYLQFIDESFASGMFVYANILLYLVCALYFYRAMLSRSSTVKKGGFINYLFPLNSVKKRSFWIDVQWYIFSLIGFQSTLLKFFFSIFYLEAIWHLFNYLGLHESSIGSYAQHYINQLPPLIKQFSIFLVVFLLYDFSLYWVHRAYHRFRILWALHKIHHYPTQLTIFAAFRSHPLEQIILSQSSLIFVALFANLIVPFGDLSRGATFFGNPNQVWYLLLIVVPNIVNKFNHCHFPISYGNVIDRILISPRVHLLHHSKLVKNKNFGGVLSIWDQLFGTYEAPRNLENHYLHSLNLGTDDAVDGSYETLLHALFLPIKDFSTEIILLVKKGIKIIN
ncbi:hypothetical protein DPM18_04680 [Polynucleobacter paneuropaeus]|uniref:sterol desaturase family protein n=1 Tax=Polynucleobacter paneuropaeus TaxID=2527775 RepID=UPI000DBF0ED2|nr:sterol desaturase family protein [Polynucleobacter paneuropaeus]AWW46163.1 hypothetical protein DPM18_04680 [Polynucleobacter paneuropaeus]